MNLRALSGADAFSIVTTSDPWAGDQAATPWQAMFDWPRYGDADVPFAGQTAAQRNLWAARLDEVVAHADKAVLLVASGASCFAAVHWARLSPAAYVSRVAGALLFAPGGGDRAASRRNAETFASPATALPFSSFVIDEGDDEVRALAQAWGSRMIEAGDRHALMPALIQRPDALAHPWRQAQRMLMRWSASVVEHKVRGAEALAGFER